MPTKRPPQPAPSAQYLIAHRGWRNRFPENTLPAIRAALEAGAVGVEIDVQLSADQVPVLCHDADLMRLCGVAGDITAFSSHALTGLSAHEPDRFGQRHLGTALARLADVVAVLGEYPQSTLYVELKRHSLRRFGATAVLDAVLPPLAAIAGQCVLISFDLPVLQAARERGWRRVGPILVEWAQACSSELADLQPLLLFCDSERIPAQFDPDALPAPLAVYEVPDYPSACHWRARGARYIETFAIGDLLAAAWDEARRGEVRHDH